MTLAQRTVSAASLLLLLTAAPTATAGVVISPAPGTPTALPGTQISFLGARPGSLVGVRVIGSRSGRHKGHLRAYASAVGMSFIPHAPFRANEHVTVRARWRLGRRTLTLSTHFKIAKPVAPPLAGLPVTPGTPADVQSFHTLPALHPPAVTTVSQAPSGASGPGYLFATPFLGPGQYGPMIFDSAGNLVWFKPLANGEDAADLHTQTFDGRNDLTWWQGRTIALGYGLGEHVIANANYTTVAVVRAGNGLKADEHDLELTPRGSAFLLAYSPVRADLAAAGGPGAGVAVEGVIQEIDVPTGLVMWEWHSLAHVGVSESYSKLPASPAAPYDYFHINSLDLDSHGNVLISARNTWTIYELNGRSGAVIWRLGGKRSTFKLGSGVRFAYQHDARWLSGDRVSLFDDEGAPAVAPPSRGELVALDPRTHAATLAGALTRAGAPLSTDSQGSLQALANGSWMVGWGGLPNLTEFDARGEVVFDAQLPAGETSYRVYRLPWAGQPTDPPVLAASTSGATTTAYASWNGATTVASWQLMGGTSASRLTAVATVPRSGFETAITASADAYFAVRALSASGRVLATSNTIAPSAG